MNNGVPPTARKARTGELTPPGITRQARWYSSAERGWRDSRRVLGRRLLMRVSLWINRCAHGRSWPLRRMPPAHPGHAPRRHAAPRAADARAGAPPWTRAARAVRVADRPVYATPGAAHAP